MESEILYRLLYSDFGYRKRVIIFAFYFIYTFIVLTTLVIDGFQRV